MKITPSRIVMTLVVLALIAGLVFAFMPRPVTVDVVEITRGPQVVTVDEDGRTRIRERYVVSTPLAGQLQRIELRSGDRIVAGETVLAEILPGDPALLDARAIAEAEARVRRAEAALRRARPLLEQARAQMDFAENEVTRVRMAYERNAATAHEMEQAILLQRRAIEEYNAAQFAEDIARYELELAQAALLHTRPDEGNLRIDPMTIRAPIDGRVLRVMQESMAVVSPGTPLLEVGDPADLEIEIDVLSTDAVRIREGAKVFVERWGGERELQARVRLVEPQAFTRVSALGVEEQRVNVIADFTEPPEARAELGDGYRIEARIVVWQADDVVLVPTNALFRRGDDWAVFVVEGPAGRERARLQTVRIGRRTAIHAEVIDGLQPGEVVIAHPGDAVRDGVRVGTR